MKPTHIIIHHSLTKDSKTVSWGAIRDYHLGLGWSGIGYHDGVELARNHVEIFRGRMPDEKGAHCRKDGMNNVSIGICCVGNYDHTFPSFEIWREAKRVTKFYMRHYGIKANNVHGHGEIDNRKTCPGRNWDMNKFRSELK